MVAQDSLSQSEALRPDSLKDKQIDGHTLRDQEAWGEERLSDRAQRSSLRWGTQGNWEGPTEHRDKRTRDRDPVADPK